MFTGQEACLTIGLMKTALPDFEESTKMKARGTVI
jgi:hypothetical protein